MYNLIWVWNYASDIIQASEDVSVGCRWYRSRFGQYVLKTFEMAIWRNMRTTRTELKFSVAWFISIDVQKYFSDPLTCDDRPTYGSATEFYTPTCFCSLLMILAAVGLVIFSFFLTFNQRGELPKETIHVSFAYYQNYAFLYLLATLLVAVGTLQIHNDASCVVFALCKPSIWYNHTNASQTLVSATRFR